MVVTLKVTDTEILKKWSKEELQEQFEKFLIIQERISFHELVELEEHEIDSLPEDIKNSTKNFDNVDFVELVEINESELSERTKKRLKNIDKLNFVEY